MFAYCKAFSQSPAPIAVPTPAVLSVTQPVTVVLTPAQLTDLVTLLGSQGIVLPPNIKTLTLKVIQPVMLSGSDGVLYLSNTNSVGGAVVTLRF